MGVGRESYIDFYVTIKSQLSPCIRPDLTEESVPPTRRLGRVAGTCVKSQWGALQLTSFNVIDRVCALSNA